MNEKNQIAQSKDDIKVKLKKISLVQDRITNCSNKNCKSFEQKAKVLTKKSDKRRMKYANCIIHKCKKEIEKTQEVHKIADKKCRGRKVKAIEKMVCIADFELNDPRSKQAQADKENCIKKNCNKFKFDPLT